MIGIWHPDKVSQQPDGLLFPIWLQVYIEMEIPVHKPSLVVGVELLEGSASGPAPEGGQGGHAQL